MVWRTVTPVSIGDSQRFSGADINKVMQLFSGVSNVDNVDINSPFKFRSGTGSFASPDNSAVYTILMPTTSVARNLTLPLVAADDNLLARNSTDVLKNKDLRDVSNLIATISTGGLADNSITTAKLVDASVTSAKIADNSVSDNDIAAHTTTK